MSSLVGEMCPLADGEGTAAMARSWQRSLTDRSPTGLAPRTHPRKVHHSLRTQPRGNWARI